MPEYDASHTQKRKQKYCFIKLNLTVNWSVDRFVSSLNL